MIDTIMNILKEINQFSNWIYFIVVLFLIITLIQGVLALADLAKTTIKTCAPLQTTTKRAERMQQQTQEMQTYFEPIFKVVEFVLKIRILKRFLNHK